MTSVDEVWVQPAQRAGLRSLGQQTELLARVMRFGLPIGAAFPLTLFSFGLATARGTAGSALRAAAVLLGLVAIMTLSILVWHSRRAKMTTAMTEVAHSLGGVLVLDNLGETIGWLDRCLPWPTRMSILLPGSMGARRWCAMGSVAACAVLVSVFRRARIKSTSPVHRIDVFVSAANGRHPAPEALAILSQRAGPLGFDVVATQGGIHLSRPDSDPGSFAAAGFGPLLEAASAALR